MLIRPILPRQDEPPAFAFTSVGLALATIAVTASLMLSGLGLFALSEAEKARGVQEHGVGPAVCLLTFLKTLHPTTGAPELHEYEVLQEARFRGIPCPMEAR